MSGLEALYQQLILDHSKTPHGRGFAGEKAASEGESHQYNPVCGDEVTVRVTLDADGTHLAGLRWEGRGCTISQASASMFAALIDEDAPVPLGDLQSRIDRFREVLRSRGTLTLDEEEFGDIAALSGVSKYSQRVKCAMLAQFAGITAFRGQAEDIGRRLGLSDADILQALN